MYKRIVVKIGTKVLSDEDDRLDGKTIRHLVGELVNIRNNGTEVVVVTSGAVGAGRSLVDLGRAERTADKQVLAAVGQVRLMETYARLFGRYGVTCAQVLVTKEDFRDRSHYLNMRGCFENILKEGIVPLINENDVVATTELLFTDNDELAGLVASQLNADAVILLTAAPGFVAGNPRDPGAEVVPEIRCGNIGSYEKYVLPDKTAFGRGGMLTKFNIARRLALAGINVHLAEGKRRNVLTDMMAGRKIGTLFMAAGRSSNIKRRIAYSAGLAKGSLTVNRCAEDLLTSKTRIMSLLPVGVIAVEGEFVKGDIVGIRGASGRKLGFGIARCGSGRVRELMGGKHGHAIIHYDHMFIDV